MVKKLYMHFTNEDEQPTTILVQQPNQKLNSATVRSVMERIIAMELFEHKGQAKYAHIKGARYVDKKTEILL